MQFSQLHPYGACSSVILHQIWTNDSFQAFPTPDSGKQKFLDVFAELFFTSPATPTSWYPNQLSFVVASTISYQSKARRILTETLGFTTLDKNYNSKNGTKPYLSVARVDDIREKLIALGYNPQTGKKDS